MSGRRIAHIRSLIAEGLDDVGIAESVAEADEMDHFRTPTFGRRDDDEVDGPCHLTQHAREEARTLYKRPHTPTTL